MNDNLSFPEISDLHKKMFYNCTIAVIFLILGLISFSVPMAGIPGYVPGIIFFAICIIFFVKYYKMKKVFRLNYKQNVVLHVLNQQFQNVNYRWDDGFDRNLVYSLNLISPGNTYSSEDYLSATYKNVHFEQADVTVKEVTTDSDGNTSTTVYFRGRMIVIDYPKITSYVRAVSKKFYHSRSLRKSTFPEIQTENVQFNNLFKVRAASEHDAFYLLTPPMMEKLMYILSSYGNVGLCCQANRMIIAINTKRNAFDANAGINLDYEKEIRALTEDVALIENLIDILYS